MSDPTPTTPFIVLGDDLSPGADVAWLWTHSQIWPGWSLIDLRAEPPAVGDVTCDHGPHELAGPTPRPLLGAGFDRVTFVTDRADPRLALERWPDARLTIVGEASSGLGPHLIGSTTEWLLRAPTTPVVLARRGRPVTSAIVCADGSPHAAAAARAFVGLPWAAEVDVDVVVIEDGSVDTNDALDDVEKILTPEVASVSRTIRHGRAPHREILRHATSTGADLLVLGTRGHSTLRRLTLGSTANTVAQLATASVLVADDRTE